MGINIFNYRNIIPKIGSLIRTCQNISIPIFFTQSVRKSTGNDLLTTTHQILPETRQERVKDRPLCIQGTWDADIIDEFKPFIILEHKGKRNYKQKNNVVVKRIDSVFHHTGFNRRLKKMKVDTIIFCGIDTSICVESSIRDAFNLGYDVILI
jgi:ureidoacrylate peracid hydrolase